MRAVRTHFAVFVLGLGCPSCGQVVEDGGTIDGQTVHLFYGAYSADNTDGIAFDTMDLLAVPPCPTTLSETGFSVHVRGNFGVGTYNVGPNLIVAYNQPVPREGWVMHIGATSGTLTITSIGPEPVTLGRTAASGTYDFSFGGSGSVAGSFGPLVCPPADAGTSG